MYFSVRQCLIFLFILSTPPMILLRSLSGQFEDAMAKDAAKEKAEEDAATAAAATAETPPPAAPAN